MDQNDKINFITDVKYNRYEIKNKKHRKIYNFS